MRRRLVASCLLLVLLLSSCAVVARAAALEAEEDMEFDTAAAPASGQQQPAVTGDDDPFPAKRLHEFSRENAVAFRNAGYSIVRVIYEYGRTAQIEKAIAAMVASDNLPADLRIARSRWSDFESEALKRCGEISKKQRWCVMARYGSGGGGGGRAGELQGRSFVMPAQPPFRAAAFDKFVDKFIARALPSAERMAKKKKNE